MSFIVEIKAPFTVGQEQAEFHPVTFGDEYDGGYTFGYRNDPSKFKDEDEAAKAASNLGEREYRVVPA